MSTHLGEVKATAENFSELVNKAFADLTQKYLPYIENIKTQNTPKEQLEGYKAFLEAGVKQSIDLIEKITSQLGLTAKGDSMAELLAFQAADVTTLLETINGSLHAVTAQVETLDTLRELKSQKEITPEILQSSFTSAANTPSSSAASSSSALQSSSLSSTDSKSSPSTIPFLLTPLKDPTAFHLDRFKELVDAYNPKANIDNTGMFPLTREGTNPEGTPILNPEHINTKIMFRMAFDKGFFAACQKILEACVNYLCINAEREQQKLDLTTVYEHLDPLVQMKKAGQTFADLFSYQGHKFSFVLNFIKDTFNSDYQTRKPDISRGNYPPPAHVEDIVSQIADPMPEEVKKKNIFEKNDSAHNKAAGYIEKAHILLNQATGLLQSKDKKMLQKTLNQLQSQAEFIGVRYGRHSDPTNSIKYPKEQYGDIVIAYGTCLGAISRMQKQLENSLKSLNQEQRGHGRTKSSFATLKIKLGAGLKLSNLSGEPLSPNSASTSNRLITQRTGLTPNSPHSGGGLSSSARGGLNKFDSSPKPKQLQSEPVRNNTGLNPY